MFSNSQLPPLFVPDLTKPAGATVDVNGNVTCIACGTQLPVAKADIVGQGYRCAPCSHRADVNALATGASDVGANLSTDDRSNMRTSGFKLMIPGIAMLARPNIRVILTGDLEWGSNLPPTGSWSAASGVVATPLTSKFEAEQINLTAAIAF